jgi:hypothetical protein
MMCSLSVADGVESLVGAHEAVLGAWNVVTADAAATDAAGDAHAAGERGCRSGDQVAAEDHDSHPERAAYAVATMASPIRTA